MPQVPQPRSIEIIRHRIQIAHTARPADRFWIDRHIVQHQVPIRGPTSHDRSHDRLGCLLSGSGGGLARRLGRLARLGRGSGTATPGGFGRCFFDHFRNGLGSRSLVGFGRRRGLRLGGIFIAFTGRFASGTFTAATMTTAAATAATLFGCAFFGRCLGSFF